MKKVISLVTGVSMILSSTILSVSAEAELVTESEKIYDIASSDTNKITDLEQIAVLLKNYIDENHPGDATVAINDKDSSLDVIFRKTAIGEEEFDGESIYWNMAEYLEENNVDSSFISNKFTVSFRAAAPADTDKITDLEQISVLLKKYIDENHPGDATVAIYDEDGSLHVKFRKTAIGEEEFDGESIYWNMVKYLEENNVDPSYISNEFEVEFLTDAPSATSSVTTGDINFNGSIDVTDLTELSLVLIGDKELSANQQKAADIDGDGAVTLADLARLQQYLSKKINSL